MSFWDLSTGESAKDTGTEYETGGGNMLPIPEGSSVLAAADEVKWAADNAGNRFISLRWSVLVPEEYKNRKVFHKLWVTDLDPSAKDEAKGIAKRDKARKMLAAIDANAGGKLAQKSGVPTDDDLGMALINKPMIVTVQVWQVQDRQTGGTVEGNWVCAVNPKSKGVDIKAPTVKPARAGGGGDFDRPSVGGSQNNNQSRRDMDDEIPF